MRNPFEYGGVVSGEAFCNRGKEPSRDKAEFPWFWNGSGFTGDRVNDVHLTIEQKRRAREG